MTNSSLALHSGRGARRSTRVNQPIPVVVAGVDSFRGPYQEEVSTIAVSCHGCRYESRYEVLPEASVLLQLNPKTPDAKPVSTRGRVKWTKRPTESGGLFQTAIELEQPGNIWGIDSPPTDWLTFNAARTVDTDTSKAKQVAVLRPAQGPEAPAAPAPAARPTGQQIGQLMGGFQQQMEKMLSEAANAVLHERAGVLVSEMRAQLCDDAKRAFAEVNAVQTERWSESARTLHGRWTNKIETELQRALARVDMQRRELEEASERLVKKSHEQLESFIEGSRKEGVDKIVVRLKEQSAPVIASARRAAVDLTKRQQELEELYQHAIEHAVTQIEETCGRLDQQFEMILRERLDSAGEELERAGAEVAKKALGNIQGLSQKEEEAAQARVREALDGTTGSVLASLKAKAAEISREFGGELSRYSRSHLEFVSGAIGELAKGIGKLSKD